MYAPAAGRPQPVMNLWTRRRVWIPEQVPAEVCYCSLWNVMQVGVDIWQAPPAVMNATAEAGPQKNVTHTIHQNLLEPRPPCTIITAGIEQSGAELRGYVTVELFVKGIKL
jgi:hypothetical protein